MFQVQQPTSLGQPAVNPIIINLPPVDPNHERQQIQKSFPKRVMMLLSILQIVCGGLVFLMQIAQYFVGPRHSIHIVGWGIWTGIIFAASGMVGFIGAFKPSKCIMIAFLVLNIISSIFTLCVIVPVSIGIFHVTFFTRRNNSEDYSKFLALYCLMLILGLVQAVSAIVASGYSCAAVCCRQNSNYPGTVIFAPHNNTNNHAFVPVPVVSLNSQTATQSEDCPPSYKETSNGGNGDYKKLIDCA
jgi:hypothetical protein